jgi:hypothetical protein
MFRRLVRQYVLLGTAIGAMLITNGALAAWIEVDNFQSGFGFGGVTPVTIADGQNNWVLTGANDGSADRGLRQIVADPTNANNAVLKFLGGGGTGTGKSVSAGQGIADGTTGTMFLRFYMDNTVGVQFGISSTATAVNATGNAGTIVLGGPTTASNELTGYVGAGPTATPTQTVDQDTWYNLWIVLGNSTGTAADSVQFYLQGGNGAFATQQQLFSVGPNFEFTSRFNFDSGAANELLRLAFRPASSNRSTSNPPDGGILFVDDIYINNAGQDLTNPVPEPHGFALAAMALIGLGLKRRQSMLRSMKQ